MRRIAITSVILGFLLVGTPARGAFGDVVASFPAPAQVPSALAWDGRYLWVLCNTTPSVSTVFRLNPDNGSVISSFASPYRAASRGLTWDGTYLYLGRFNPYVVSWRSTTGSLYGTFTLPAYYGGLAWDGSHLWATDRSPYYFYRVTTRGSLVSSFPVSFFPFDPGFGNGYLFVGTFTPLQRLYKLTTAGSIVESANPPANHPWGCCFDGTYVWFTDVTSHHYIWKCDAGQYPAVVPASVGRVKGLFR